MGNISDPIIQLNKITFLKINEIKIIDNKKFDIEQTKKNLINKKKIIYIACIHEVIYQNLKIILLLNSNEKKNYNYRW